MAMDGKTLGDDIAELLYDSNAAAESKAKVKKLWEKIGKVIVKHIVDNIDIQIPVGSVIISVTGGSGSPAVGTPNESPISVDVDPTTSV